MLLSVDGMNVILRGKTKDILKNMVDEGYANSQSEAIRLAIINFAQEHLDETESVNRKLDRLNQEIKEEKSQLLNPKQALGKHAKWLE